jgi:hypothetical protein
VKREAALLVDAESLVSLRLWEEAGRNIKPRGGCSRAAATEWRVSLIGNQFDFESIDPNQTFQSKKVKSNDGKKVDLNLSYLHRT